MKSIKSIILGASTLLISADTAPLPPTFYRAIKIADTNSAVVINTEGITQTEIITNWSNFIPKWASRPILTPLITNGGYEFGFISTNTFINITHEGQQIKTIVASKTNFNLIFERKYEFTRIYNEPAWLVRETR